MLEKFELCECVRVNSPSRSNITPRKGLSLKGAISSERIAEAEVRLAQSRGRGELVERIGEQPNAHSTTP